MTQRNSGSARLRGGARRKPLEVALAISAVCGTAAWLWAVGGSSRPLEATIQLERFAASLEHTTAIGSDTARDLERMLALPYYDCARIRCSADVQARNSAVRARIETLMAMKMRPGALDVSRRHGITASSAPVMETR